MTTSADSIRIAGKKAVEGAAVVLRQRYGGNFAAKTVEVGAVRRLCSVTATMQRVVRSRTTLFGAVPERHSRRTGVFPAALLGRALASAVATDFSAVRRMFPKHILHPHFELLEAYVAENGLQNSLSERRPLVSDIEWLNRCVTALRQRGKTVAFVRARDEFIKTARRRISAQRAYVDALLREHGQLYVVRLNLGYAHEAISAASAMPSLADAALVSMHRLEFLRLTATLPSLKRVGFIWKLNHSGLNSYSIDMLLFYRTDTMWVGSMAAQCLGDFWVNQVTGGQGSFYNFNALPDSRIGYLHRDSLADVEYLKNTVAAELVCGDYYAKLDAPDRHVFEKGNLPKAESVERKRGRPRTASVKTNAAKGPRGNGANIVS